jgi:hypothetical protein
MEIVYIYSLSNPISNEVRYIGKSTNIENRYKQHIGRCKKEVTHKCSWIKNLQTENLKPKIEIVDLVESGEWQFWEKYWISQFKSWGFDLVNSTDGGDGILLHSDFTKKYMSNSKKGVGIHDDDYKKILSEKMKGNSYTLGKKLSDEHKRKISNSQLGIKKHTEESKNIISTKNKGNNNGMYGKKHNQKSLEKISENSRGENHPKVKLKESDILLIREYYKNKTYNQKEVAKIFNISYSLVTKINNGTLWKHLL